MKKIVLGLFVLISCFVLLFIGVKTKAVSAPVMVTGASIRATGERQGLKFSATVDSLDGVTEHGFYVALGEHTQSDMATAINADANSVGGKKLKKVEVTGSDTTFHAVIYNIPEASYGQVITAIAYISDGSTKTLSSEVMTRNIADIARGLYNTTSTYDEDNNQVYTVANASRIKVTHSDSSINYYGSFASFSLAAGDTIELAKGTYSEALPINVNNVTLKGVNNGIHYDGVRSVNESVITGQITLSANTTNCTIDGFKFEGTSKVTTTPGSANANNNTNNFVFRNNVIETNLSSGNGFIIFDENETNGYSQNLTFSYNHFKCINGSSTLSSLVYLENNIGLVIDNNKFENAPNKAVYIQDTTSGKGMAGDLTLTNNIFTSIGTNAFDVNWFSPYGSAKNKQIAITNNTFTSVTGQALRLYKANAADAYASFNITNNTFTSVGTGLYSARINSTYKIKFNNNIFNTRPTTAYAQVDALYDGVKLNARYNLFKESEVVVLPNEGKYNSARIDIFSPTTGAPDDLLIKTGDNRQLDSSNLGLNMTGNVEFDSCSSDDESVATISASGLITTVAAGETDLHATVVSYNNIPLTIHVEVVNGIVGVSAVLVGGTTTYSYAGSGTREWSTTNASIATIDEDGELTALAYGEIEVVLTVNSVEMDRLEVLITPNEFYVDDNWSSYSNGEQITYNTKKYVKGLNAFHTISSSLAANRTINVLGGVYSDDFTISNDGVTLYGPDKGITLVHTDSYTTGSSHAKVSGLITTNASNITIQGFEIANGIKLTGNKENILIKECIITASAKNEVIYDTNVSTISSLIVDKVYVANSNNRLVYIYGTLTDLTVRNSVVLDSATGVVDFVRAGSASESTLRGTINILNNYIVCTQSGFHERNAGADIYNFTGNYFYNMPNAIYSKNLSTKTGIVYNITCNTFNSCLKSDKPWDVVEIDPSANKTVNINYNAFANTGTRASCYSISVLGTATINADNNYFKAAADKVVNNVTPTDWELEEALTTASSYDNYKVVKIADKYYIYGVNLTTSGS